MNSKKKNSLWKKTRYSLSNFWSRIRSKKIEKNSFLIYCIFLLSILDAILTLAWIKSGLAIEANPFLAPFLEMGDCAFYGIKILITGAACIILYFNKHRALGSVIISATVIMYVLLTLYHFLGAWASLYPEDIPKFIEKLVIVIS